MEEAQSDRTRDGSPNRWSELEPSILCYLWALRAGRKSWVLTALAGLALGWLGTAAAPPSYRAHASVEVAALNQNFVEIGGSSPTAPDGRSIVDTDIPTHVRILRNDGLRQAAIERLIDVGVGPRDPKWAAEVDSASKDVQIVAEDNSRVIDIYCQAASPKAAAAMANQLAELFVAAEREKRRKQSLEMREWMEGQFGTLAARLQDPALEAGLTLQGSDATGALHGDFQALKRELLDARGERMRLQARVELLSDSGVELLPDEGTPYLRDQQAALTSLLSQRAHLAAGGQPEQYKLQQLEELISETREGLAQERVWIVRKFEADFIAALRREDSLEEELQSREEQARLEQAKIVDSRRINREAGTNREVSAAFIKRIEQAETAVGTVRILDRAEIPIEPHGPRPILGAAAGSLTGLFAGCLFVMGRAKLDRTIKRPGDAQRALGLRELGAMPDAAFEHERVRMTPAGFAAQELAGAERACVDDRPSWLAECVRGIRTSLLLGPESPRFITITSPTSGEGKTTVAANLAASLAESGRRTLVVDADLRRPRLHEVFGVSNSQGLVDLVDGSCVDSLDFVIPISKGLWFLPAGVAPFGGPGLIHEASTREILERLGREFDAVVLDAPPVLAVSDARILSRIGDGTILVVRAGVTDPDDAIDAKTLLEADEAHLLGVVLNSWNPRIYGPRRDQKYGTVYQGSAAA